MSLGSLWRRLVAFLFPVDSLEGPGPVAVFEEAIRASRQRFLDVRATAAPLYQARDKLKKQEEAQRAEVDSLKARALDLLRDRKEQDALELSARQGRIEADVARTRQELVDIEAPVARVEEQLRRIEMEIRDLERERDRSASVLKGAQARVAVDRILATGSNEHRAELLAEARDLVTARVIEAQALEQLSAETEECRLAALEKEQELDSARARLEGLKATLELPPADGAPEKKS